MVPSLLYITFVGIRGCSWFSGSWWAETMHGFTVFGLKSAQINDQRTLILEV